MPLHLLHNTNPNCYPCLTHTFTIDHNRYLVNDETSHSLNFSRKQWNLKPSCSTVTFTFSESIRGRHKKSLIFLSDFNKRRDVSTFRKNPEYKVPHKSFHSESRCSTRTERLKGTKLRKVLFLERLSRYTEFFVTMAILTAVWCKRHVVLQKPNDPLIDRSPSSS